MYILYILYIHERNRKERERGIQETDHIGVENKNTNVRKQKLWGRKLSLTDKEGKRERAFRSWLWFRNLKRLGSGFNLNTQIQNAPKIELFFKHFFTKVIIK